MLGEAASNHQRRLF